MKEMAEVAGTRLLPLPTPYNDVLWFNNWIPGLDLLNVDDLTKLEVEMRKMMRRGHEFLKKNVPTFEKSFILDTAPQTGTRGSRRLIGEYLITADDIKDEKTHEDTVAIIPRMGPSEGSPLVHIPYRCLVPKTVDGLLVAGRSFSSDMAANNMVNLIPHCIAMGQASGTAAALAVKHDINVRQVNHRELQDNLVKQGVILPSYVTA